MFEISVLSGEQSRQIIDTEQAFSAWKAASAELKSRYSGSMAFKTVAGRDYLYRKTGTIWKSLGPRNDETELTHQRFHQGRERLRERTAALTRRLDELAAVNRAMRLGRLPLIAARILRALGSSSLMGSAVDVVGTHCIFAYERMAGARVDSQLVATGDIDLLFDARTSLRLLGKSLPENGWLGLLQQVDHSFHLLAKGDFRAANDEGFLVDLITPTGPNPIRSKRTPPAKGAGDLTAVEIEGLVWLVNSPKVEIVVLDARGYPVIMSVPDPRSFALHKLWVSERDDRDAIKKRRDRDQADLVARLLAEHMPHLRFDDPALQALPSELRQLAARFADKPEPASLEPGW
ncbi:nucleotidyltransferase domain-containing protein [Neorhizobium sp. T25_13]|uniref:GSU2403 family nucleotidyltransferase fold protein n=1 Tax=Neorhizobium sp. T25_13 TaxID=2093830 RepID=UPI000CF921D6|nr:nucleotidyltransferase domain-containing protein [Neorhizobium sp. T25_13]